MHPATSAKRGLRRLDEARQEILRAIKCAAQYGHASPPWTSWSILVGIETDASNPTPALEAQGKVITYLASRCEGGENHDPAGRISLAVTQHLLTGDSVEAAALLQQLTADPDFKGPMLTFIRVLLAIVSGSRDRSLADWACPRKTYSIADAIVRYGE